MKKKPTRSLRMFRTYDDYKLATPDEPERECAVCGGPLDDDQRVWCSSECQKADLL